jgi:outer membrane receptor protein involved in Fe transport
LVRTPDVLTPSRIQKKHALWGAGLTYRTPDEHWRLGIEVRNITDERVQVNSFEVGPIVAAGYTLPRTWALTASYDF